MTYKKKHKKIVYKSTPSPWPDRQTKVRGIIHSRAVNDTIIRRAEVVTLTLSWTTDFNKVPISVGHRFTNQAVIGVEFMQTPPQTKAFCKGQGLNL